MQPPEACPAYSFLPCTTWSCATTSCSIHSNSGLAHNAWSRLRRRVCDSRGRGRVALFHLPRPSGRSNTHFWDTRWERSSTWVRELIDGDAQGWLAGGLQNCTEWAPPEAVPGGSLLTAARVFGRSDGPIALNLLLADLNDHQLRPGALAYGGNNTGWDLFKVQYCVLLKIVKLLMSSLRPKAAFLLNYAAEWAALGFLQALDALLGSCGIKTSASAVLHMNVGLMLAFEKSYAEQHWHSLKTWAQAHLPSAGDSGRSTLQVRQSYWSDNAIHLLDDQDRDKALQQQARTSALCKADNGAAAVDTWTQWMPKKFQRRSAAPEFLLLGGQPRDPRGLVFLELSQRGLLRHARWSSARYAFCDHGAATVPRCAGPFTCEKAAKLLDNTSLVTTLCAQLPRVLDHDPANKTLVEFKAGALEKLWGGTRFALTFETYIPDRWGVENQHLLFVTEKPFKPMQARRPFVLLGPPGASALLRALGFRHNSSFDGIASSQRRISAALDEAARLVHEPSALEEMEADAEHNQRHVMCANGLRRRLYNHATHALSLGLELSRQV